MLCAYVFLSLNLHSYDAITKRGWSEGYYTVLTSTESELLFLFQMVKLMLVSDLGSSRLNFVFQVLLLSVPFKALIMLLLFDECQGLPGI